MSEQSNRAINVAPSFFYLFGMGVFLFLGLLGLILVITRLKNQFSLLGFIAFIVIVLSIVRMIDYMVVSIDISVETLRVRRIFGWRKYPLTSPQLRIQNGNISLFSDDDGHIKRLFVIRKGMYTDPDVVTAIERLWGNSEDA